MDGAADHLNHNGAITDKQVYDDLFSFPSQLPPSDFRSGLCDESLCWLDFEHDDEFLMAHSVNDTKEQVFVNGTTSSSSRLDLAQNHYMVPDVFFADDSQNRQQLVLWSNKWGALGEDEVNRKNDTCKRQREEENMAMDDSSKKLSRETISQYFYMPITRAAQQLNVGLTLLKKRCRELGIRRWPHRKLVSLQTLIDNVQEYGKEGSSDVGKVREYIGVLEQEKRLLEEIPDMQLEDTTKRLRQAFFKANYKKRRLMGIDATSPSTQSQESACQNLNLNLNPPLIADDRAQNISGSSFVDGDEEFEYFLPDWFFL